MLHLQIANGSQVLVYPKPHHTLATYPSLNFSIEDIEKAVDELTSTDVRFEIYDKEHLKTR